MSIYETWIVKSPIAHRGLFGENAPEKQLKVYNETLTLSTITPTREGYAFLR